MKFSELSPKARERAIQSYTECLIEDGWWAEGVIESAKEDGLKRGFDIDDVRWSGFWSQGDGASWTGMVTLLPFLDWMLDSGEDSPQFRRIDAERSRYTILRELIANEFTGKRVDVSIRGFHYCHSGTMRLDDIEVSGYISSPVEHPEDLLENEPFGYHKLHQGVLMGASAPRLADAIDACALLDDFAQLILTEAREFADDIYRRLEAEYDWATSEEQVAENAEINDYNYDEDGNLQ